MTNLCLALFSNSKQKKLQAFLWITLRFPWVTCDSSERFFLCFWKLLSQASNCLLVLSVQFKPNNCKHTHSYIILKLLILKGSCFPLEEKAYFLIKWDSESYKVWPHCSQWKACPWVSGTQLHPPGCYIPFCAVPVHCGACWKQNIRATYTDCLSPKVPLVFPFVVSLWWMKRRKLWWKD